MRFDPIASWVISLFTTGIPWLSEKTTKTIPAENWANKERLHTDRTSGISEKEILQRAEVGRYYIPKEVSQSYPVPHRDPVDNKIIIENSSLYYQDIKQHGAYQAKQWLKQGKYNLNEEEMEIETLRIKKYYASTLGNQAEIEDIERKLSSRNIDHENTEAVRQWRKAQEAVSKYR